MKRASLLAAALALALSLAACGSRDNGSANDTGTNTAGSMTHGNGTADTDRTLGDDLADGARDVMRDVERGVDDLLEIEPQTSAGATTTSFQRMLDNARVHDVDGVLTDGENSRW
ncbi:MAG: hypothetical protein HFF79_02410 [Oscillospiraceae bacterium]|nr:hypothetical protein [Oscillospiraceae bacterium]MCI8878078.1 hypothetical protein [Oscillospiraceae bacterium]